MAIAPDILMAISIDPQDTSQKITLANTDSRFPKREFELNTKNPKEAVRIDAKSLGLTCSCFANCRMEQLLQSRISRSYYLHR